MKKLLIVLLSLGASSLYAQNTNNYSTAEVDVTTNADWARVSFDGEAARLMYELLTSKNGSPTSFINPFGVYNMIKGGAWQCNKVEFNRTLNNEISYQCFGDFKGNGHQERNCIDASCN